MLRRAGRPARATPPARRTRCPRRAGRSGRAAAARPRPAGRPVVTLPATARRGHHPHLIRAWTRPQPRPPAPGVAGLRLEVGIRAQEDLVADVLASLGALREPASGCATSTLGLAASRSLWQRRVPADPAARLWLLGPALNRLITGDGTVGELATARTGRSRGARSRPPPAGSSAPGPGPPGYRHADTGRAGHLGQPAATTASSSASTGSPGRRGDAHPRHAPARRPSRLATSTPRPCLPPPRSWSPARIRRCGRWPSRSSSRCARPPWQGGRCRGGRRWRCSPPATPPSSRKDAIPRRR